MTDHDPRDRSPALAPEVAGELAPELAHELERAATELERATPLNILAWAADRFAPSISLATSFDPEGCLLIDLIGRHHLPIDVFTLDTGVLFPETVALWRQLEARSGIAIRGVRPVETIAEQAERHGPALWNREPDTCCRLRKVEPLAAALAGRSAWITAIRRDQTSDRAGARVVEWDARFGLVKVNPLVRWSSDAVAREVEQLGVPTNPLHARGYPSIGCQPCTSPVAPGEDPRSGRWRGAAKTECGLHGGAVASARLARPALALVVDRVDREERS